VANKRTIPITVEADQLLLIRNPHSVRAWCERCHEHTEHALLEKRGAHHLSSPTLAQQLIRTIHELTRTFTKRVKTLRHISHFPGTGKS
jgi:hypothetical protein